MGEKQREYLRNYIKNRYHNDPEFKKKWNERTIKRRRERIANDPEYAKRIKEYNKEYHSRPEVKERMKILRLRYKERHNGRNSSS